jgi:predicted dehydrogenase
LNTKPWRTLIIGFGNISQKYSSDPIMSRYYPYSTHAQVLTKHPDFDWDAVVDTSDAALKDASVSWGIKKCASSCSKIINPENIDVLIISTPPEDRSKYLPFFPNLKAVILEKPISNSVIESKKIIDMCKKNKIHAQVNYLRRLDTSMQELVDGGLESKIGNIQAGTIVYGNGLINNGSHMIDLVRMLVSEISAVQVAALKSSFLEGPIKDDINLYCILYLENGACINMIPLIFSAYRENSLDLWGTKGRLSINQEGLLIHHYPKSTNRAISNESEISSDKIVTTNSQIGQALYNLYDNLSGTLKGEESLCSDVSSALRNEIIIEKILYSYNHSGKLVSCYD